MSEMEDRGPPFRGFLIAMMIIMVLALILRFISRAMLPKSMRTHDNTTFWCDDWAALAAAAVEISLVALEFSMLNNGFGKHLDTLNMQEILYLAKLNWAGDFIYDTALFLSKMAALLFLARVFPRNASSKRFNYFLWTTFGLNLAWLIGTYFATIFFCWPISKNWDSTEPGHCGTEFDLLIGSAVPSVVIDLLILLLPLPKLWRLKTNNTRNISLTIGFILGYCVVIVSLGRLITVVSAIDAIGIDFSYALIPTYYWVSAEVPVTILSISLPAMVPLGRHLSANYFSPLVSLVSSIIPSRSRSMGVDTESGQHVDVEWANNPNGSHIILAEQSGGSTKRPSAESKQRILP